MQEILILLGFIYLLIGFIYAIYVVMSGGGSIFSIPINTLFGPLFIPVQVYIAYKSVYKPKKPQIIEDIPEEEDY